MKRWLLSALIVPMAAQASDNCVLQDRVVSRSTVQIEERSPIRRDVVPDFNNQRRCVVDFRVRIGANWHTAFGEYTWPGDRPAEEACAIAAKRAEDAVRERVGRSQTTSEKILVCTDEPRLTTLRSAQIGTVGDLGQFRPHPEMTERFYHNGTQCKWFIDSAFTGRDVRTFQGIICQVQPDQWVVVDKF
jgi:hypothetical protein